MRRESKKFFILGISIAAIVLGVYMTFFGSETPGEAVMDDHTKEQRAQEGLGDSEEQRLEGREEMQEDRHNYLNQKLPTEENETAPESYNGDQKDIHVYFSNTNALDSGNLPSQAQSLLVRGAQKFLNHSGYADVTELYIEDESYQEDAEKISFLCYMDGYQEVLRIEYHFQEKELRYYIENFAD